MTTTHLNEFPLPVQGRDVHGRVVVVVDQEGDNQRGGVEVGRVEAHVGGSSGQEATQR